MSKSLLSALGIDESDLKWEHLAACANLIQVISQNNNTNKEAHELDPFFDNYESDTIVAEQTDLMCMHCPVNRQCLQSGIEGKEYGVWGGIYLSSGKISKKFNAHKTPETWKKLKKIHGKLAR